MIYFPQFALLAVSLIWGWTFVSVKESLSGIGVYSFLFYRFLLGLLLLLILFWRSLKGKTLEIWLKGLLIGLSLFVGFLFQTWGLRYTTATNSGFITGLSVLIVPLLDALLFRIKIPRLALVGVLLSVVGLGFIVFGSPSVHLPTNIGDLLTLVTAIAFAFEVLLIAHFSKRGEYEVILISQIGVVVLLSFVGAYFFEGLTWPKGELVWKGILTTGILATAFCLWGQNKFQQYISATSAAIILSSEPVFAALFGYWLLAESLATWQWLGALLILSAMLVAQWPARKTQPQQSS